jgi:hypothetical protein
MRYYIESLFKSYLAGDRDFLIYDGIIKSIDFKTKNQKELNLYFAVLNAFINDKTFLEYYRNNLKEIKNMLNIKDE